jgi:hypothetical protein
MQGVIDFHIIPLKSSLFSEKKREKAGTSCYKIHALVKEKKADQARHHAFGPDPPV